MMCGWAMGWMWIWPVLILIGLLILGLRRGPTGAGPWTLVPALSWLLGLPVPVPVAIATSLVILGLNSLASLAAHLGQLQLDLLVAGMFLGAAALTALTAGWIAGRLPERVLRRGFAGVVLAVGTFVAVQVVLGNSPTPT